MQQKHMKNTTLRLCFYTKKVDKVRKNGLLIS